jgi:hypothetical protein
MLVSLQVSIEDSRNRIDVLSSGDRAVIRDVAVCPWLGADLICHTGDNKALTLMSTRSGQEVLKQPLHSRLQGWSCAFSSSNHWEVWVGTSSGCLMLYDVRRVGHVTVYEVPPPEPQDSAIQVLSQQPVPLRIANSHSGRVCEGQDVVVANTFPPVQSILHTTSHHQATASSSSDVVTDSDTTSERIVICQKGMCQILALTRHGALLDVFNSGNASTYVPNLSSVYDIQQCPVGPWMGQREVALSGADIQGYMFACRKGFNGDLDRRGAAPAPAVYCMGIPSQRFDASPHPHDSTASFLRNPSVATGHSLGLAASKPSACVVPVNCIAKYASVSNHQGNVLILACPDEATKSVMMSAVFTPHNVKYIGA